MRIDEYLDIVSEQIRYAKIRPAVTEELRNHILDQAEFYEACGAFPKEALDRAVREMGDPVETGVALDRIHRPQMCWGIVAAIAVISLLSIGIFYLADLVAPNAYPWQSQASYILAGFLVMLLVYRLDYSILGKFGWKAAALYLCAMILGVTILGMPIYGAHRWFSVGPLWVSVPEAMLLYLPLFGAALYSFRGEGYGVFLKIIPLMIFPAVFVLLTPTISYAAILFVSLFCLFLFAVWKDWFLVSKKAVLGISFSAMVLAPFALLGYVLLWGPDYQADRIRAFLDHTANGHYLFNVTETMRASSALFGSSEHSLYWLINGPTTEFLTDYILVSMCSIYGVLLTAAIIVGILLIILKIFRISVSQKNQLGMIIGMGCGFAFLFKTVACILINLQLIPYFSVNMPFLSYGGTTTLVSYILLGLVLSVYRYKNILPAKNEHLPKRHLRIKLEWETR